MSLSRRAFIRTLGQGGGAFSSVFITARGREALVAEYGAALKEPVPPPPDVDEIRISSNENPKGPGPAAIKALRDSFDQTMRYPMNARMSDSDFRERLAKRFGVKAENIVLGPGSTEILRNAVRCFTGPDKPLVTGECSYENPVRTAEHLGHPVKAIPNASDLSLDLDKMAGAAVGAGLVFLCNPNNPTATAHSAVAVKDFVKFVSKESPYTAILIDEAYHEYVTDPAYDTAVPLAMRYRNVFVSRTFSKAYGMAGLRQGYAVGQKEIIDKLRSLKLTFGTNILGIAAAMGSLDDPGHIEKEVARNVEARKFTLDFFNATGYPATDSQTNFIFVNIGGPAKEFREACKKYKVMVGRDFPPYEKTHARISIGTMDEMRRATEVFRKVLGAPATDSPARG
ncbi:MAG: pyridoxal phosphate-dependent aminotransferase [Acidobacteriota bacterium]